MSAWTETRIANRLNELPRIVAMVDRFGAAHGIPVAAVNDLNLVLDEVLNNIVTHGFAPGAGSAGILVRLRYDPGLLRAEIEDDGMAFDPLSTETAVPVPAERVGGRGIRFMRGLMDEVAYQRAGEFNRLCLTKRIPRAT